MATDKCSDLLHRLASRIMVIHSATLKLANSVSEEDKQHIEALNGAVDESIFAVRTLQLALNQD